MSAADPALQSPVATLSPGIFSNWVAELQAPHRHYHRLEHILAMEALYRPLGSDPAFRAAIWLHDIVYDPRRGDNEERSAEQARRDLKDTGIDIERVARIILDTKHHAGGDPDTDLFADLDLSIFAASPDGYQRYADRIRSEYGFVPLDQYVPARIRILETFDQRQIFKTATFTPREAAAHANLRREIAMWRERR